ncbi:MAG: hypothetical protein AAGF23_19280 [Acidobacteriota bacterium]
MSVPPTTSPGPAPVPGEAATAPPSPGPGPSSAPRRPRPWTATAAALLLLAAPVLWVDVVPSTDLPQLTAQLRLLADPSAAGHGEVAVQWWHPNKLGYLPLAAGWWVAGPERAGAVGLALVVFLWVGTFFGIARRRFLEPAHAALGASLVFNVAFHWGFVNFLLGLPLFLWWVDRLDPPPDPIGAGRSGRSPLDGLIWLGLGALLYAAHVLWLAVAVGFMVATSIRRRAFAALAHRLLWLTPVAAAVVAWYVFFRDTGVDQRLFWGQPPWWRLHPGWLVESLFGGTRGVAEPVLAAALAAWAGLGFLHARLHRRRGGSTGPDRARRRGLLEAAALLFALAFLLPAVYHHTILFAARWLAPGMALLVLAAPAPRLSPLLARGVPWVLTVSLSASLLAGWLGFQDELGGFDDALQAVGRLQGEVESGGVEAADGGSSLRLLGLDFIRESERIDGYPYHHLPALAQVRHGVALNRSFADDPASLVVFAPLPHEYPWTDRLDWTPEKLRRSDFDHFDLLLAHAPPELHGRFDADPRLAPLTGPAAWRLYRILRPGDGPRATEQAP